MHKPPRWFQIVAFCLIAGMAWANARGYMVSSYFNDTDHASRTGGQVSHK